jgi:hypothetical protein
MLSLKTMTESKLKVLKREVEAAIHSKVTARRQEIESELSKLTLLDGGGRAKVIRAAAKRTGAVKYRNSAPARKAGGRKLDESVIADGAKLSTAPSFCPAGTVSGHSGCKALRACAAHQGPGPHGSWSSRHGTERATVEQRLWALPMKLCSKSCGCRQSVGGPICERGAHRA